MNNLRQAAQQALECLKGVARGKYDGNAAEVCAALEAALAQQAEQAWVCPESPEHRYAKPGHCEDCGKTLVLAQKEEPVEPRWEGDDNITSPFNACMHKNYCVALKEERERRLAQQAEPVQEPVAWAYMGIKQDGTEHGPHLVWKPEYMDAMSASKGAKAAPLYTAPPQQAEPVSADAAYQRWLEDTHAPALRRMDSQGAFAAGWQAALAQQAEPKPMSPEQRQRWEELAAMPQQTEPVQGWTDADADAARLALELECLLTDKDVPLAAASRWWDSAHEALQLHRKRLADALAQQAEPVAGKVVAWGIFALTDGEWQLQHPVFVGDEQGKVNAEFERASYSGPQPLEVRPLGVLTAPPQRKPLTDEKISDLWCEVSNTDFVTADTHVFARAIERAHGIKE